MKIILAFLMLLASIAAAQPLQNKLSFFARDLYHPNTQVNLLVVGDSINASNSPNRMGVGYRNQLHISWNAWMCHADSGVSDNGYLNAQNVGSGGTNEIRIPGDTFACGSMAISPVRARDVMYAADVSTNGTLIDCALTSGMLSSFPMGNPFSGSCTGTLALFNTINAPANIRIQGIRNGSVVGTTDVLNTVSTGNSWGVVAGIAPGFGTPGIRVVSDGSTIGENYVVHGVVYHGSSAIGVQYYHIAHGGWTIADHLSSSRYTDTALNQFGATLGVPTHIMIWLGQNMTPPESASIHSSDGSVFKNDLSNLIERYHGIWPQAKFLLIAQYQTGYSEFAHRAVASKENEIASDKPYVSFYNLYDAVGGTSFNTSLYTTDGIHPSLTGSNFIAATMDADFQLFGCPADFDSSGFVDIDDYDAFISAFESGSSTADVDMSGFTDIEDFAYFVDKFEQGC